MSVRPATPVHPVLSVVVAAWGGEEVTARCLSSLEPQGRAAEVIVATNGTTESVAWLERRFPYIRLVRGPESATVLELRALGAAHASGRLVAFTEDHVTFGPGYVEALSAAHEAGHGLLAGPVENGEKDRAYDWALFFCEYGLHLPPIPEGPVSSVSGLNVAYGADLLALCRDVWWRELVEHQVNDALREKGISPWMVPAASVSSHLPFTPAQARAHLFQGGLHFGRYRASRLGMAARAGLLLASPLVLPLLISRRMARVLRRNPRLLPRLATALPWLVVLDGAWSAGEAWGTVVAARRAP